MKKKAYLIPEMLVVTLATEHLLTVVSDTRPNKDNPTENLDDDLEDGGDDPGSFSRRGNRNVWDDEEDLEDRDDRW